MLPLQALEEARQLIDCGWCQGAEACDWEGNTVEPWDARACSWSLPGAVRAVAERTGGDSRFLAQVGLSALALAILGPVRELQAWNDLPGRTVADVLSAYEAASSLLPRPPSRQALTQAECADTASRSRAAVPAAVADALHRLGRCRAVRTAGQSALRPLSTRRVAAAGGLTERLATILVRWRGAFARRSGPLGSLRTRGPWSLATSAHDAHEARTFSVTALLPITPATKQQLAYRARS